MPNELATCTDWSLHRVDVPLRGCGDWGAALLALLRECLQLRPLALVCSEARQFELARLACWVCGIPLCERWVMFDTTRLLRRQLPRASRQVGLPLTLKRGFDIAVAAGALGAFAPAALLTALAIRLSLGSPVLFSQERPGRYGRPFRIYKFRTMTSARAADGSLLPDAQRLTHVGRIVRAASLDELPQLWNVLWGDMSLIGPRPLLMQYLTRYDAEQARRHNVLPGITGLAQVNGRNATTWTERLRWDVKYVELWSLTLDARVLLDTLTTVLKREGISQPGHATMPEFQAAPAELTGY